MIKLGENDIVRFGPNIIRGNIYLSRMAKDYIEYNLDMGYTLGLSVNSIDTFAKERQDVLEKLDLFYLLFNNANFGTVNLVDPTLYKGTAFGGLTWRVDSVQGNGINGYINTNFNPALLVPNQKYQLNDACRFTNVMSSSNIIDGIAESSSINKMQNLTVTNQLINQGGTLLSNQISLNSTGIKFIIRTDSTNVLGINKNNLTSATAESTELYSANQLILTCGGSCSFIRINLYGMGASLTFEETQLLRTSFNKLLKTNGLIQSA